MDIEEMKTEDIDENMSNISAASYMPEFQVIKLKPDFDAFSDPENLKGFTSPIQLATFFHEWIHYFHNISTILGLTTFCNLTIIWSNFRNTIGPDGWSNAAANISESEVNDIIKQNDVMYALRSRRKSSIPSNIPVESILFSDISIEKIPNTDFNYLRCQVCLERHEECQYEAQIGTYEIHEFAAFILEKKLCQALNSPPSEPQFDPYLLVQILAKSVAPELSEDDVLRCALASLQTANPPQALLDVMKFAIQEMRNGIEPEKAVAHYSKTALDAYSQESLSSLERIQSMFTVDEPMARFIKGTCQRIRENIEKRKETPFIEFSFIDHISKNPSNFNSLISTYGAPTLIQQQHGDENVIGRDIIYEFANDELVKSRSSDGRTTLYTAFRFAWLHIKKGAIAQTNALTGSCPLYTSCVFDYRKNNPHHCRHKPWLSVSEERLCDYGIGVHITRPPAQEGNTEQIKLKNIIN
ncbi:hypothetical protein [Rheinheimera hassiensis]|uniref:hypothetical protein n=1 Tax=Rheinheimera hassiensis TaxID=1193627 RepID=UPI001F05B477|nr:hypothetical protein [Rheinheimera hassiensis]